MQLVFTYDLEKDTENFIKSFSSVNSKKPTPLQELYMAHVGELDATKVPTFLSEQGTDIPAAQKKIESLWREVEEAITSRMEELFGTPLGDITAYLSTNSRCTYSIEKNYFFVYMNGKHTNGTISHELLHFYTWHAFHKKLEEQGVSKEKYNDIKEALTEILNTDFSDLLIGYEDKGYPQHQEIREKIRGMRQAGETIDKIIPALMA